MKLNAEKISKTLTSLTIFPLTLGGIWQLISLSNISIEYIRFFSVNQLLVDGVLILTFSSVIFFALYFFWICADYGVKIRKGLVKNQLLFAKLVSVFLLLFIAFSIFYVLSKPSEPLLGGAVIKTKSIFDGIMFFSVFFAIFCGSLSILIPDPLNRLSKFVKKHIAIGVVFFLLAFIIITVFFGKWIFSGFENITMIPKESVNYNNLKNKYCSERKISTKNFEVLYQNDKYIFVRNNDKVEILKFDAFFETEALPK